MRITCPECATVLKPAQPVPPGKKVKCPRCGATFIVPAPEEDAPRPAAAAARKAVTAPRPPKSAAKPKPPPADDDEDDEGGGAYGLADHDAAAAADEPKVTYAPDTSIKDMRGPASAILIVPTNTMLAFGVVGFFGWMFLLIFFLIPKVFPIERDEGAKDSPKKVLSVGYSTPIFSENPPGPTAGKKNDEKEEREALESSFYYMFGINFGAAVTYDPVTYIMIVVFPMVLGMVYAGVQTLGAVKAQRLESQEWGMAACIMGFIPVAIMGAGALVLIFVAFLLRMVMDDMETVDLTLWVILALVGVAQMAVSGWNLATLQKEEVVLGFEYVPEMENEKPKKEKPRKKRRSS